METQAKDWEKILAKRRSGEGLVCRIYKELPKVSNNNNFKNPSNSMKKKKGKRFGHFTKDIPTANSLSENAKHH